MLRRRVRFIGRVQGVGFRMTARAAARGFAVTGWVRNEADGSVLVEIQGAESEIDGALERLRRDMRPHIRAERADDIPTRDDEEGFDIAF
jgi:acylphosphatase